MTVTLLTERWNFLLATSIKLTIREKVCHVLLQAWNKKEKSESTTVLEFQSMQTLFTSHDYNVSCIVMSNDIIKASFKGNDMCT